MNVAELFVQLGVKGADQAGKALKGTKDGLGEVKTMSLEAKAAILGTVYALQSMMSHSAQVGTDLKNLSAYTGLSTDALQRWGYAAQQVGVDSKEAQMGLANVAKAMADARMGHAAEGHAMIANKVGLDPNRLKDTQYVMGQLQKFAQIKMDPAIQNMKLASMGLSQNMISAMKQGAFETDKLSKAQYIMSDSMVKQNARVGVAWDNLATKIQYAFAKFTNKNGMQIVGELSKITEKVLELSQALLNLGNSLKVFKLIGMALEGIGMIASGTSKSVNTLTSMPDYKSAQEPGKGGIGQWLKDASTNDFNNIKEFVTNIKRGSDLDTQDTIDAEKKRYQDKIAPSVPAMASGSQNTFNIEQNLNFQHDGKDAQKTGSSVGKAVKETIYQLPAMKRQSR